MMTLTEAKGLGIIELPYAGRTEGDILAYALGYVAAFEGESTLPEIFFSEFRKAYAKGVHAGTEYRASLAASQHEALQGRVDRALARASA